MSARTQAEIRAEQMAVLSSADPQTLRSLGVDAQFRAILADHDQPRFARQQEIETAIVTFNPNGTEAWEILEALKAAIQYRYQAAGEDANALAQPFEVKLLKLGEL